MDSLQSELYEAKATVDSLRQQVSELERTLENTINKMGKSEKESLQDIQRLTNQLKGKEEMLRQAKATRACDQATTEREKTFKADKDKFKNGLENVSNENKRLKFMVERLQKQLQAEKKRNGGPASDPDKGFNDEDDEEPLPSQAQTSSHRPVLTAAPTVAPKFQLPILNQKISELLAKERGQKRNAAQNSKHVSTSTPDLAKERKRKRNVQEEIDKELEDLNLSYFEAPTAPRKRIRRATSVEAFEPKFNFKAITSYGKDNSIYTLSNEEVSSCAFLIGRIEKLKLVWESSKGEDWMYEFERPEYTPLCPPCVSKKLAGGRAKWRPGFQGIYACRDCVKNGRPCFTWLKSGPNEYNYTQRVWCSMWEFRLLPLHKEDREKSVKMGKSEVRFWINDGTVFRVDDVTRDLEGEEKEEDYEESEEEELQELSEDEYVDGSGEASELSGHESD